MNGTVLDILIYVFDRYMFDEAPEVPEREELARDLESAGFGEANVERALDWLADLAGERHRPARFAVKAAGGDGDARPGLSPGACACIPRRSSRASRPAAAACCCRWNSTKSSPRRSAKS